MHYICKATSAARNDCPTIGVRDAFGNILARGGETWYVAIAGEDAGLDDTEDRLPVVVDEGEGSYTVPVHPGKQKVVHR